MHSQPPSNGKQSTGDCDDFEIELLSEDYAILEEFRQEVSVTLGEILSVPAACQILLHQALLAWNAGRKRKGSGGNDL